MKVSNKSKPEVYNLEVEMTADELKEVLIVLRNATNRIRYYHPASDALYKALNDATGGTERDLDPAFYPGPLYQDRSYYMGYHRF